MKKLLLGCLALLLSACMQPLDMGNDQTGEPILVTDLAGRWLVINYWAEWCAPCRREIPQLNQLADSLAASNVKVFGVNYDQLQGDFLKQASEQMGIQFRVFQEDPAARFRLEATDRLPVTYLIHPDGETIARLLGEQTAEQIIEALVRMGWSRKPE